MTKCSCDHTKGLQLMTFHCAVICGKVIDDPEFYCPESDRKCCHCPDVVACHELT